MAVQKYDIPLEGGGFEERHWSCMNAPVLGPDGEILYIVHRAEDVTEFVRLREQRTELLTRAERMESEIYMRAGQVQTANRELARLNDKLKRNDELKSQFFANVSHELRTPLTLILGPVDRALSEAGRSEGDERLLQSVKRNARLLLKHVNDILEITTLEAGKVEPSYVEVDLARLARQIAGNFESLAEVRQLELLVRSPEHLVAQVDPAKLQRIVLNLLANAIKFTPPGGTVEFTVELQGEQAALSVADSGPGIPEELRTRVFERFFQSEEASTRRYGGTGLGLSIVREFVQLHGGSVEVAASASGGALFTVRLPLHAPQGARVAAGTEGLLEPETIEAVELLDGALPQPSAAPPTSPTPTASASPPTAEDWGEEERPVVLVVEDNRDTASYICASLGSYRTRRARNGREGLESALAVTAPALAKAPVKQPAPAKGPRSLPALSPKIQIWDASKLLSPEAKTKIVGVQKRLKDENDVSLWVVTRRDGAARSRRGRPALPAVLVRVGDPTEGVPGQPVRAEHHLLLQADRGAGDAGPIGGGSVPLDRQDPLLAVRVLFEPTKVPRR